MHHFNEAETQWHDRGPCAFYLITWLALNGHMCVGVPLSLNLIGPSKLTQFVEFIDLFSSASFSNTDLSVRPSVRLSVRQD